MSFLSRLRGNVVAFPLAALAALAMVAISEISYQDAKTSLDSLGDRGVARNDLNDLIKGLVGAEAGQRGYLLTSRPEYLRPYTEALRDIDAALVRLRAYYGGSASTAAAVEEMSAATEQKLSELATTIKLHDEGAENAWHDLLLSDIGREKMERVRTLAEKLLEDETAGVTVGRDSVYHTLMLNRIGVSAMAALSLLALFMYLRQTAMLDSALLSEAKRVTGERDRLETEVDSRTGELRELAQHLQTIREDERSHLARELHDELGALLTAAKLDAARLKSRLGAATPEVLERLAHLNEQLNSGIALKRRIIEDLRPSSLSNLGLRAALEILLREFAGQTEMAVNERIESVDLDAAVQLTVYRLVQEALTNVAKYARANEIDVVLEQADSERVRVCVSDNGVGFDASQPRTAAHGLLGMRYRVEAEGGTMDLHSAPGEGTKIEAWLPVRADSATVESSSAIVA